MLGTLPRVSFCIPTLNSERTLEKCLRSIKKQRYPDFEILIIDGCSTDHTLKIAERYADSIWSCKGSLGEARQIGVEKSTGEILALFDDDVVIPQSNWLTKAVKRFDDDRNVSTVWPLVISPPNSSLFARCYSNFSNEIKMDRLRSGRGYIGGTIALFRKRCVEEVGGFDRRLPWGEDFDIAKKLKEGGYRVVFHEDPLFHETMMTIDEFLKKQILGARTFLGTGFDLMNLDANALLYEHLVVGFNGMFRGLFKQRDESWLLFPLLLITRLTAYATVSITGSFNNRSVNFGSLKPRHIRT